MSQYIRIRSLKMRWVQIWATFGILTIASIYSEHAATYLTDYWEWQSDDCINNQDMQGSMWIKGVYQSIWHTHFSCHFCINAIKQYSCIAILQITLSCNMIHQSLFARYWLYHHTYNIPSLMLFGCFWRFGATIYEYICLIHKSNIVDWKDHSSYNDFRLIKASW